MTETENVRRHYSIEVTADVRGADLRPTPYSTRDQSYRPTSIDVTYNWSSDDTEQTAQVTIAGPVLLKDGTEGRRKRESLWSKDEWPQWVKDFVTLYRPSRAS